VTIYINAFLSDKTVFDNQQHGFTYQKSCFTNLLETFEDWTLATDLGQNINVVFLNFKKAFDSSPSQVVYEIEGLWAYQRSA